MRLGTRLFLFVAILLLVISVAVYLVPVYVLKRHTAQDQQSYLLQMERERSLNQAHYALWLADEIAYREATVNAFLYLLAGQSIATNELLHDGQITESVWLASSKLLGMSEMLTFFQLQQGKSVAAITLSRTELLLARQFEIGWGLSWISTGNIHPPIEKNLYLGIWLSQHSALMGEAELPSVPQIFLLFDPEEIYTKGDEYQDRLERYKLWLTEDGKGTPEIAHQLSIELLENLEVARQYLITQFGPPDVENQAGLRRYLQSFDDNFSQHSGATKLPKHLSRFLSLRTRQTVDSVLSNPLLNDEHSAELTPEQFYEITVLSQIHRMNDIELITALGYLSSAGAIYRSPFDKDTPVGATRILAEIQEGTAVMSAQAFSKESIFDGADFLSKHLSSDNRLPIGDRFALLDHSVVGAATLANTILLQEATAKLPATYLTLGASLNQVLSRLAQISGQTSMLLQNGKVVNQVDLVGGAQVTASMRLELEAEGSLPNTQGFLNLSGEQFYYTSYQPNPNWDITFLTLEPAEWLLGPIQAFEERSRELTLDVSRQITAIALGIFVIALIVLEILTRHFTRPITTLAQATKKVAEGKYEEIQLPAASAHSRNEITILTHSFAQMVKGLRDREKLRAVLDKVVSKEIANEILRGKVHLGGEVREVTVLFADIRGFTHITEKLPPDEVIVFINSYMTVMTEVLEAYRGVIDKYVGDEIMALFGAPVAHTYSALQGILAALVLRKKIMEWNAERKELGLISAHVGIGVHTGPMVAGNMGAEDRLNYTVMGANVNLAARLCQDAEGGEILIVEQMLTQTKVSEFIHVKEKDIKQFKGFSDPIKVYQVIGLKDESKLDELTEFLRRTNSTLQAESSP